MYVQNLSIFERNRLLTKPNTHLKKVRDHVRNDKKSILSSQLGSELKSRTNSYNKGANLIENQEIQMKIIKKSVNQLRPKGSWYPNQQLEGIVCAKFSGSPQPKKLTQGKLGNLSPPFGSPVKESSQRNLLNFELNPFKIGDNFNNFGDADDGLAAFETT